MRPPPDFSPQLSLSDNRLRRTLLALELLWDALDAATAAGQSVWEFAVEISELRALGLASSDLRWLLCQGYAEHAQECTTPRTQRRAFRALQGLVLPTRSCFVLTTEGMRALRALDARDTCRGSTHRNTAVACPRWDGRLRRLLWCGQVVKQFRLPATNQEGILAAFEEQCWPLNGEAGDRRNRSLPAGAGNFPVIS